MRISRYILVFFLGFFIAKFWYQKNEKHQQREDIEIVVNSIKNISKLVVSSGSFSEVYNFTDSKKYFYDFLSFDKEAIVTVNAKVEVGYDLSKLEIQIDSVQKKIYIHKIPDEEVSIFPEIKYFDLKQSQFNSFSKEELNTMNAKSIEKIKKTAAITALKKDAKNRFFEEISKVYQLSSLYNWEVIDNTKTDLLQSIQHILD